MAKNFFSSVMENIIQKVPFASKRGKNDTDNVEQMFQKAMEDVNAGNVEAISAL